MESYIRLSRKIREHWIWEDAELLKKWLDLLMLANYAEGKFLCNGKLIKVDIGEHYTSEEKLAKRWGISRKAVDKFLKLLESDGMIEIEKNRSFGTRLKVLNYGVYQGKNENLEQQKEHQKHNEGNNESTTEVTTGVATGVTTEAHQKHINNNNKRNIKKEIKKEIKENKEELNNSFCSELEATELKEKPVISLMLNDKSFYPVCQNEIDKYKKLYPAVDIMQELRKMSGWLDANPTRRKTKSGINRFINSWLSKAQDMSGNLANKSHSTLVSGQNGQAGNVFFEMLGGGM